ncbi:unnamed protein product [Prorocentrum cordatum]|uniref:Uncharacterized protein n=1 Tax=Prorocentrum cordatum TaxID=2364126 RepID=A0ABN9WKS4_9DINO|nr:unnamed protein product [Polarella glacialis]
MAGAAPMAQIEQGRRWLEDGEAPEAVAEEALALAGGGAGRGAWLVVAAEALCAAGEPQEALAAAGEALALLRSLPGGDPAPTAAAACALVRAHLAAMNWDDAISVASVAVEILQATGDPAAAAPALLELSRGYLGQMRDLELAAGAARSAAEMSRSAGDANGVGRSLQLAAEACLMQDPSEALEDLREAVRAFDECGNWQGKAAALQLAAAARAHASGLRRAARAMSEVTRSGEHARELGFLWGRCRLPKFCGADGSGTAIATVMLGAVALAAAGGLRLPL